MDNLASIRRWMAIPLLWLCMGLSLVAAGELPGLGDQGELVIDVGRRRALVHLGFGWSQRESVPGRTFSWIKRLEADVWFHLDTVADLELELTAAPLYLGHRRQNIGVFLNNHFVTEWVCPDSPEYADYRVAVPADVLREGKNRLTLRMGYRRLPEGDERELALAVDKIVLRAGETETEVLVESNAQQMTNNE